MPGRNCFFPNCTVSRTAKHENVGIFKIPMRNDDFHTEWRTNMINVMSRYREFGKDLKARAAAGRLFVCEKHFALEDIEFTSKICY